MIEPTKLTDAVLILLGDGAMDAAQMAERINLDERFNTLRERAGLGPRGGLKLVTATQVYAAMSGLRSKGRIEQTFIQPVGGRVSKYSHYELTGYGEKRLRKLVHEQVDELIHPVEEPETPVIDHPAYYGGADDPYEAIKVIEAWGLGYNLGNALKYISRAGKKGDALTDLRKARWYIDREIANREGAGE